MGILKKNNSACNSAAYLIAHEHKSCKTEAIRKHIAAYAYEFSTKSPFEKFTPTFISWFLFLILSNWR